MAIKMMYDRYPYSVVVDTQAQQSYRIYNKKYKKLLKDGYYKYEEALKIASARNRKYKDK